MPGSALRSVALALLMSTIAPLVATVLCGAEAGWVGAVVAGVCDGAIAAGSAASTGPAMVRARRLIGRRENFMVYLHKEDETFRPAQNAALCAALPKSRKDHKCDFFAVI